MHPTIPCTVLFDGEDEADGEVDRAVYDWTWSIHSAGYYSGSVPLDMGGE